MSETAILDAETVTSEHDIFLQNSDTETGRTVTLEHPATETDSRIAITQKRYREASQMMMSQMA